MKINTSDNTVLIKLWAVLVIVSFLRSTHISAVDSGVVITPTALKVRAVISNTKKHHLATYFLREAHLILA